MKRTVLIAAILLLLIVSVVSANQVAGGQVGDDSVAAAPKTEKVLRLYDPDPAQTGFYNAHKCTWYSRTSKNGEQTDIVREGNFFKECFIGSDNKVHIRRCGNVAYQVAVEETIVCPAGPAGKNGYDGKDGADGANGAEGSQGPRGPRGFKGDVGTGITNNYFTSAPVMCGQIGGQSPYMSNSMQLMSVNLVPLSNTNISVSASATGGAGGIGGGANVVNNNANSNTNVNANNNVINVGDGSASGTATGTGSSTANAGN